MDKEKIYLGGFYFVTAWLAVLSVAGLFVLAQWLEPRPSASPQVTVVQVDLCEEEREEIEDLEYRLFWFQQTHCGELPEHVDCGAQNEETPACDMETDEVEDEERVARETVYIAAE